jgi:DNA invertase Pin-like site-specific DNA recombinase
MAKIVHDVDGETWDRGGGPALQWALDQIAMGEADTLVVARLRKLSPTLANLPPLLRWFTDPERRLVAIDLRLDTATDAGRLAAFALVVVGSWENERLSARTRRGLEAARSRGAGRARAAVADVPELREYIIRLRKDGMTLQAIADVLNDEGVPTLRGGAKWRPSSVHGATGYRRPTSTRGIHVPDESPGSRQGASNKV